MMDKKNVGVEEMRMLKRMPDYTRPYTNRLWTSRDL